MEFIDAPTFTEAEEREQARVIVKASLRENALEALEYYSRSVDAFDVNIFGVGLLIADNETMMDRLITVCLSKDKEQIQSELENELP
jgi:hypothetical protein